MTNQVDVVVIGAGAAGLMAAIEAGKRGRRVLVLERSNKPGKKILMSGGGRCNFTNYHVSPENYISNNAHFCKSALKRYTQWDFIEMVKRYDIPFHEKKHGQLFCDGKSKEILNMLLAECEQHQVSIQLNTTIKKVSKQSDQQFKVTLDGHHILCESLVVASGGLSIPTLGASPFGYKLAEQFGIRVWPVRAGLVPFTLHDADKSVSAELSGVSVDSVVGNDRISFAENILFTHRGLSGPAVLQISSYWLAGEEVAIDLVPGIDLFQVLTDEKERSPKIQLKTVLINHLPKRVVTTFLSDDLAASPLQTLSKKQLQAVADQFNQWMLKPNGTEGYRTAEVTLGGVDCNAVCSKTMVSRDVPGLYFIGEVLDVTGWLGGFNFQWAWSSGWAAGQVV